MKDSTCITMETSGCGVSIPGSSGVGVCVGVGVGVSVGSGVGVAVGSGVGVDVGVGAGVGVGVLGPSGVERASNCTTAGCGSPQPASIDSSKTAIVRVVMKRLQGIFIVAQKRSGVSTIHTQATSVTDFPERVSLEV